MARTFGPMDAVVGESCSNPGEDDRFTSPCCYEDFDGKRDACPKCGAPLECTIEQRPYAVCTIVEKEVE